MLPGFEPVSLDAHLRRFKREAEKTAPCYDATFSVGEGRYEDGPCATATVDMDCQGPGWKVQSEVVFYGLAEFNNIYMGMPGPKRFLQGFLSVLDLCLTGAALRYLRDGWRFFLFFLSPFLVVAVMLALIALAVLPPVLMGIWHAAWSVPLAFALSLGASALGRRTHVPLIMDLWMLTVDVARGRRAEVNLVLDAVVEDIAARIAASNADEIIVVGHSFGAIPAIMALADARVTRVAQTRPVGLLAAGSFLLAVAHHPAAKSLREASRRVMRSAVAWLDAQSHTDPVNFFRTNPADALRVDVARRPSICEVRFKHQLSPESYRAIRGDFFRTHRQFVFGVERRSHYSLFAIIGGPERFADVTARGGLLPDWTRYAVSELGANRRNSMP